MLKGSVDHVAHDRVWGWAFDPEKPDARLAITVLADGKPVARCRADQFRQFLLDGGIGDGGHGFVATLSPPLTRDRRQVIEFRRDPEGDFVPGSPQVLEASLSFDDEARAHISRILTAADSEADFRARLAFLETETARLKEAWAQRGFAAKAARSGEGAPRALVIAESAPGPTDALLLSHVQALGRLGFRVDFASVDMEGDRRLVAERGAAPRGQPEVACVEELLRLERDGYALVWLRGLLPAAYVDIARRLQRRARLVWAADGLAHLAFARQAQVEQRPELHSYAQVVHRQEVVAALASDAAYLSSAADADALRQRAPAERIVVGLWSQKPAPVQTSFAQRRGLVCVLRPGEPADVDAAHTLVESLMPLVWGLDPEITATLVGGEMPAELAGPRIRLARRPSELAEVFAQFRLSVGPVEFGTGVKPELFASLAAGVPCVFSALAAKAIAPPPELARCIAQSPEDFARCVVELHNDPRRNAEDAEAGLRFVEAAFSEAQTDAAVAKAAGLKRTSAPVG